MITFSACCSMRFTVRESPCRSCTVLDGPYRIARRKEKLLDGVPPLPEGKVVGGVPDVPD